MIKNNYSISQFYEKLNETLADPLTLSDSDNLTKYIVAKALLNDVYKKGEEDNLNRDKKGGIKNLILNINRTIPYQYFFKSNFDNRDDIQNERNPEYKKYFRQITLCFQHRPALRDEYFLKAFSSGEDIFYVSMMSQENMNEMDDRLEESLIAGTKIRALTWYPTKVDGSIDENTIEALRKHLGENKDNKVATLNQVKAALKGWKIKTEKYSSILEAKAYKSLPTLQAVIVKDKWALVELLPYNLKKNDRPGLLLFKEKDREAFNLFVNQFEKLWVDADGVDAVKDKL